MPKSSNRRCAYSDGAENSPGAAGDTRRISRESRQRLQGSPSPIFKASGCCATACSVELNHLRGEPAYSAFAARQLPRDTVDAGQGDRQRLAARVSQDLRQGDLEPRYGKTAAIEARDRGDAGFFEGIGRWSRGAGDWIIARASSARSASTENPEGPDAKSARSAHGLSISPCRTAFTNGASKRSRRSEGASFIWEMDRATEVELLEMPACTPLSCRQ